MPQSPQFLSLWHNMVQVDLYRVSILALDLVWVNLVLWLTGKAALIIHIYEHKKRTHVCQGSHIPKWPKRGQLADQVDKGTSEDSGEQCLWRWQLWKHRFNVTTVWFFTRKWKFKFSHEISQFLKHYWVQGKHTQWPQLANPASHARGLHALLFVPRAPCTSSGRQSVHSGYSPVPSLGPEYSESHGFMSVLSSTLAIVNGIKESYYLQLMPH